MSGARFAGQSWAPTAYTAPLSDSPVSDGPRLITLLERHWRTPDGKRVVLDEWQRAGFPRAPERRP